MIRKNLQLNLKYNNKNKNRNTVNNDPESLRITSHFGPSEE